MRRKRHPITEADSRAETHSASVCLPIDVTLVSHERVRTNPNCPIEVLGSFVKIGGKTEKRNHVDELLMNKNQRRILSPSDYILDIFFTWWLFLDYATAKSGKMDLAMARTYWIARVWGGEERHYSEKRIVRDDRKTITLWNLSPFLALKGLWSIL